jgi:MFS family permease
MASPTSQPESPAAQAARDVEKSTTQPPSAQTEEAPLEGTYAWTLVAAVFLINAHTWGINSAYGVFLAYYISTSHFPGATSLDYAFVGGLSLSMGLLIAPIATICTRQFGTRVTLLVGVGFETLALLGASWAKTKAELMLSQGACFGFGIGFLFVGSVGVIPQWFTKRRSLANGEFVMLVRARVWKYEKSMMGRAE